MKNSIKQVLTCAALACTPALLLPSTTKTGKSFFSPQSVSAMLAPQTSMFEQFARRHADKNDHFFLSVTPFFTSSSSSAGKNLRHFFFPAGKDELVVAGSEAGVVPDISGTWLQIMGENPAAPGLGGADEVGLLYNNFQSKISISPRYENEGAAINFYKNITKHFFIAAELAVLQSTVKHNVAEYDVQNQTTRALTKHIDNDFRKEPESRIYSLNATEAFTSPLLSYGKLSTDVLKKEGISDLAVKAGYGFDLGTMFAKLVLPTSQKPTATHMFEPLTGNGGHAGLGLGATLNLEKALAHATVHLFNAAEYVYLFENKQLRTCDLTNRPWSRYLLMRELGRENTTPAVDYLTLHAKVTPGSTFNWQTQLGLQAHKLAFNVGYSFYYMQSESVRLDRGNFVTQFNIADQQLDAGVGLPDTILPDATIAQPAGSVAGIAAHLAIPADRAITEQNIQLQSAQQPEKLMSQLGISAGIEDVWHGAPYMVHAGYSYTIDHKKTALEGWALWMQLGLKI